LFLSAIGAKLHQKQIPDHERETQKTNCAVAKNDKNALETAKKHTARAKPPQWPALPHSAHAAQAAVGHGSVFLRLARPYHRRHETASVFPPLPE
jgi:hypothetical protein